MSPVSGRLPGRPGFGCRTGSANGSQPATDLILLDYQLPGTTGDQVCLKLLADEQTCRVPVVVSSAMRNRAFAQYTEFANVIDQIPKPFTPELLKSGVANALQTVCGRSSSAYRLCHAGGRERGTRGDARWNNRRRFLCPWCWLS